MFITMYHSRRNSNEFLLALDKTPRQACASRGASRRNPLNPVGMQILDKDPSGPKLSVSVHGVPRTVRKVKSQ
jgi:hypothetical protein